MGRRKKIYNNLDMGADNDLARILRESSKQNRRFEVYLDDGSLLYDNAYVTAVSYRLGSVDIFFSHTRGWYSYPPVNLNRIGYIIEVKE